MAFRRLVSAPVCAVLLGFVATGPFVSLATAAGRSSAPIEQRVLGDLLLGRLSANNEWAPPTGRYLNTQPIGWVLLVHGGGWIATGKTYMEMLDAPIAGYLRSLGWGVYMVDYRPLGNAFWDTVAGFDYMAARLGPRPRICVWGDSAGAQLAMMLAAIRPRVSCVISEAGPTDLTNMASQRAFRHAPQTSPLRRR